MTSSTTCTTTKELVERFYYEGWNKADETVLKEVLAENVKFRGALAGRRPKRGFNEYLTYLRSCHAALAKYTCKIEDCVISAGGSRVAVRLTNRGVHRDLFFGVEASGHEIHFSSAAFLTVVNDRIVEIWVLGDKDDVKNQIGAEKDSAFDAGSSVACRDM